MEEIIGAAIGLAGACVGGGIQWAIAKQKSRSDAIDKIRERQVLFAASVSQYLLYVRNVEYAENKNRARNDLRHLSKEQNADLSARYRTVVSSAYALMACGDVGLRDKAEKFLRKFEEYAEGLRDITTGNQGDFPKQDPVDLATSKIRDHKPSLRRKPRQIRKGS
ncbi:hypothetical protein IRJ34_07235 [Paenarthrobacter sp. GOM3]|uniref:hypothetical protein n=1 Tax=Paenarthrobacter sp. GOM3 TaxID=2782567 RepID=UPI001BAA9907|nr:hypothetical protein [Paenarthrobacter sp. GOM3]WOH20109.1 hypothetical protein IRJ34_07235 [Paenarthrobacter sp. GOM3]